MLSENVEVVAVRVKRRDAELGPPLAVVGVVVVGTDVRDVILAQSPDQAARDRRLAGGRIAHDAEDDRPLTHERLTAPRSVGAGSRLRSRRLLLGGLLGLRTGPHAAQGDCGLSRHEVVEDQQLDQGE